MRYLMFSLFLVALSGCSRTTREQDFWAWFQQNESRLFNFEKDQDRIFRELAEQLQKVDSNLTFEFSGIEDNRREFIISANGIRKSFPKVESLYNAAPKLPRWTFIKFRPRREAMDLSYNGTRVKHESVLFELVRNGSKGDIVLYLPGYSQARQDDYHSLAFLFLDQALGEYDVETRVGVVDVRPVSEAPSSAQPFRTLAEKFEALIPRIH